jgi:hypothetical protein
MKLHTDDSVVLTNDSNVVGIVVGASGDQINVRIPTQNNIREKFSRRDVRPLADFLSELWSRGTKVWNGLNLSGESSFSELVTGFGYSTQRLRQNTVDHVIRQFQRAGLEVVSLTGGLSRDDRFTDSCAMKVELSQ